jgi:hypothetical protein
VLAAALAAAVGCSADNGKKLSEQPTGPVAPTGVAVTVTASRTSLAASSEATSTITVRAIRTDTGAPIPDYTNVTLTTTLGALDSPTGGNSVTLPSINGTITVTFFPGDVEGTARLNASVLGAIGIATITIRPAVEVVPPPTASTLAISSDTVVISDDDATTFIGVTATVLGSNLKPFKKAPVYFSVNPAIGLFNSSGGTVGDVIATNSAGQASDVLVVNGTDLTSIGSLSITANLAVEGGGIITAAVSITVDHGPAATKITLSADKLFIDDDGSPQNLTLSAHVQDANLLDFPGATVTFSSSTFPSAQFSPVSDTTDSNGVATSVVTLQAADVAAYSSPTNSFTITATIGSASSTITITIIRKPQAAFSFNGSPGSYTVNFVNQSTGTNLSYDWDFDTTSASTDSTLTNPQNNYPPAPASYTVRLTVTNSAGSSTVFKTVTVPLP